MITRRQFLKVSAASMAALYASAHGKFLPRAFAQIPGGSLDPNDVTKYALPVVIPPAMPGAFGKNMDKYRIAVRQFEQHILPQSMNLPPTTVWSYGSI
ncbi:MAG TPA: twin-arginine translocation signal domain-containing protein, partial [Anaerolineales bacterium]|nr:twin-arginine translocation signal domain-containing protein [Anaerolineales bacterium]